MRALAFLLAAASFHGTSVQGRPIAVTERGDPRAPTRILVVGCIHGNEPAGIAIARRLAHLRPPHGVAVWTVPDLNPDGVAANTRQNARGVDLNRNFPFGWQALPRGTYYSGPHALSEPESLFAYQLIQQIRPTITIWYHQHLDVVDQSGADVDVERRYAHLVGEPLVRLTRYPGSVAGWENHAFPGTTAFVVELPAGSLTPAQADRYALAVLRL